jgi:tetratricopeptide (TPR) repeat protein
MDARSQLQATLGSAYTLQEELTGGGMSRVFVARETALDRLVVVKLLPPELAQGVSTDRFKREIQLAAQLQHPHIVPVHTAGEADGLPYYTMPFVDGASLRARITKGGPLPIGEVLSVLRDVSKALAYAHARGVVHRDIKPDNVLLTSGSAVVTDFGIAKALSASRTTAPGGTLTQIGTSIGTPAYMAPEQAAADPNTDHRADIYSFGCMAYEMLAGRPPFTAKTPQRLLAAHMAEQAQPLPELRPDTPPLLSELVMRCLAKEPNDRPQGATELVKVLETVTTSGSAHPAMPRVLLGGRVRLGRVIAIYAAATIAAYVLARAAVVGIGLPTWVVPAALIVMALGLPVILFTAFVQHGAHQAMTMAHLTPGGSTATHGTMARIAVKASPWVNWRRTTLGGLAASGLLVLLVVGYMVTRALGIGPAASLMAAGAISANERLLVADFKGPANDSTLGPTVTEAFRSDLAQSRSVEVLQPTIVRDALRRMQRPAETRIDFAVAREIATREGVKAVVDGEVLALGGGFVLAAKLVSAQTGEVLATFRQTANQPKDIIPAIDQLSRDIRARIGESLKRINATRSLEQVTTPSLDALRKYVEAVQVFDKGAEFEKGVSLLTEAIALDTGFAMAYRKLALEYSNRGGMRAGEIDAIQKAYAHRDRLTDVERYVTEGGYWTNGPHPDQAKAIAAYERAIEIEPKDIAALNNLALEQISTRDFAKAEANAARGLAADSGVQALWVNLIRCQTALGEWDKVDASLASMARKIPRSLALLSHRAYVNALRGRYDSVEAIERAALATRGTESGVRRQVGLRLSELALSRGRIEEGERWRQQAAGVDREQGAVSAPLEESLSRANDEAWYLGHASRASAIVDSALRAFPLEKLEAHDRPYLELGRLYLLGGRIDRAREMIASSEKLSDRTRDTLSSMGTHYLLGDLAVAERRYDAAVKEYRLADVGACPTCILPRLGSAYDLAGKADSAIAVFRRYADTHTDAFRTGTDAAFLAGSYKRLGELYQARGDNANAATYLTKFVELWKNADPALQPKVADAKARLAAIQRSEKR